MPVNWSDDAQIIDFRKSFLDKGGDASAVDSYIGKNTSSQAPTTPMVTGTPDALIPEAMPQIQKTNIQPEQAPPQVDMNIPAPTIQPEQNIQQVPTSPIENKVPDSGFSLGDMLPTDQAQGLQNFGETLPTTPNMSIDKPVETNDFGQPPSMPSLAGHDSPTEQQQQIPVPKGSPGSVDFAKSVPQGHQYRKQYKDDLTGECAWFSQQITQLPSGDGWTIGSAIQDKRNQLAGHVKRGDAFYKGQDAPKAGNSIIMDTGTDWGHVATVNEVMPDGKLKLTESNWNNDLKVTHDRIVDPNDKSIIGYMRTVPNKKGKR